MHVLGTDSKAPPEGSTGISKEVDCRLISVQFVLKRKMSIVKYCKCVPTEGDPI